MYMLIAIAVTILVIVLAWRGMGARTPGAGQTGQGSGTPRTPRSRPTRTLAPDDDPEFLNEIDRKLRGEDKSG
jgi:hypothetical protein